MKSINDKEIIKHINQNGNTIENNKNEEKEKCIPKAKSKTVWWRRKQSNNPNTQVNSINDKKIRILETEKQNKRMKIEL